MPPVGDLAHNPGTCADWESNQRPFGLHVSTQSTELHQPGLCQIFVEKASCLAFWLRAYFLGWTPDILLRPLLQILLYFVYGIIAASPISLEAPPGKLGLTWRIMQSTLYIAGIWI